jgi:low molecular weight phosphotyrosine protein phosphatase
MASENVSVLFVCLGNICRSTMAEGVFKSLVSKAPYNALVTHVDSCGTAAYHVGSRPDSRTMSTLEDNGIVDYVHAARQVGCSLVLPMCGVALGVTKTNKNDFS